MKAEGWCITIESSDDKIWVRKEVPGDELEYGIDDALHEAREQEAQL